MRSKFNFQVRLGQVRLGSVRFGQVRLGQDRIGQDRIGQDRIGQDRFQVRLGQVLSLFLRKINPTVKIPRLRSLQFVVPRYFKYIERQLFVLLVLFSAQTVKKAFQLEKNELPQTCSNLQSALLLKRRKKIQSCLIQIYRILVVYIVLCHMENIILFVKQRERL